MGGANFSTDMIRLDLKGRACEMKMFLHWNNLKYMVWTEVIYACYWLSKSSRALVPSVILFTLITFTCRFWYLVDFEGPKICVYLSAWKHRLFENVLWDERNVSVVSSTKTNIPTIKYSSASTGLQIFLLSRMARDGNLPYWYEAIFLNK